MELWITIDEFPNYEVSSEGRVRNKNTRLLLKPSLNSNGYPIVVLSDGHNNRKTRTVHRLVATAFYDCPNKNILVVDHIDGNKSNNHVSNLEFCTSGENNLRAYAAGLKKPARPYNQSNNVSVRVVETGEIYSSINACARAIGANRRHIGDCLSGRIKSHHGFHYERVND